MIVKYSQDNGFGMIVDTSKPWPQSPVLWWGEAVDITKPVVEAYNVQSGVAAPPPAGRPRSRPAPKPNRQHGAEAGSAQARRAAEVVSETGHLECLESSKRPRENAAFFISGVRRGTAIWWCP